MPSEQADEIIAKLKESQSSQPVPKPTENVPKPLNRLQEAALLRQQRKSAAETPAR